MMRGIIIWLVVCGLAAAMVSRDRRAVDTEEKVVANNTKICSSDTTCAWSVYSSSYLDVTLNVKNTYCECEAGTECLVYEDNSGSNTLIHRCRLPSEASAWRQS